ncbi:uncharacterized protein LOC111002624 [Pieris rapae]|uniref:uncharacterized protein LOC111002624 n=1 Tax=Pieris rapae TaxID=64459 RepID=UPI001E280D0C|nr:uncharacterized protein LOC111002624 [Pieris rapae]
MSDEKRSNLIFSRNLLKQFLRMYKESPCLWDRRSPEYKQKKKRDEAICRLTKLVNEYDAKATRVHVCRKIESLRSCVRREYLKVQYSLRHAQNPNEVYEPCLWYYNLLSFVFEDTENKKVKWQTESEVVKENPEVITSDNYEESAIVYPNYTSDSIIDVQTPQNFYQDIYDKKICGGELKDEYDAIGFNVAAKLRALPANTRILAEKLINDVLYQAQTDSLSAFTVLTSPDPIKSETII